MFQIPGSGPMDARHKAEHDSKEVTGYVRPETQRFSWDS